MFSTNFDSLGIEKLLEDKSLNADQKRHLLATSIALKLIAAVVTTQNPTHQLAEEMQNLPIYVDRIESCLSGRRN